MTTCTRCHQPVKAEAVNCPHCGNQLKAFGHPGIPLYQATETTYLCDRCIYDEDDSCNFPQRPYAKTCTLFHDKSVPLVEEFRFSQSGSPLKKFQAWCRRNRGLLMIVALIVISVVIALQSN